MTAKPTSKPTKARTSEISSRSNGLIRQEALEVGEIERSDPQDDSRLLIPGAHAGRRIDTQLAEPAGRQADPEARPLIDGQGEPGAGELLDLDRSPQPVGGQCLEPIRRARMGGKKPA